MYAKKFMKKYGHGGEVEKKMSYYKEGGEVPTDPEKKQKEREVGSIEYNPESGKFEKLLPNGEVSSVSVERIIQQYNRAGLLGLPGGEEGYEESGNASKDVKAAKNSMIEAFNAGDMDKFTMFINPMRGDAARAIIPNLAYTADTKEAAAFFSPVGRGAQSQREAEAQVMRQGTNEEESQKELLRRAQKAAEEQYRSGAVNTRRHIGHIKL